MRTAGRAHTVLIAAPTHAEIQEVTSRLRTVLQERGMVLVEGRKVERPDSPDPTEAQKRDALAYRLGPVIEPHFRYGREKVGATGGRVGGEWHG
jgi:hypothetical protein